MQLTLAPLTADDIDALFAIKNTPAVLASIPGRYPLDAARFRDQHLARVAAGPSAGQASFVVWVDGVVVGSIGHFSRDGREVEIGYYLGEGWCGRGIATRAVTAYVGHMRRLGVTGPVYGRHALDNVASGRVLEKAGFADDGEVPFTLDDGTEVMDRSWVVRL